MIQKSHPAISSTRPIQKDLTPIIRFVSASFSSSPPHTRIDLTSFAQSSFKLQQSTPTASPGQLSLSHAQHHSWTTSRSKRELWKPAGYYRSNSNRSSSFSSQLLQGWVWRLPSEPSKVIWGQENTKEVQWSEFTKYSWTPSLNSPCPKSGTSYLYAQMQGS